MDQTGALLGDADLVRCLGLTPTRGVGTVAIDCEQGQGDA
jgi:hypothetical protein